MLAGLVSSSGFKVVLTGEGADEVFGGYDLFKEAKIRRFWARQPKSRWRSLILRRLYGYLQHSPVRSPAFAAQFFGQGMEHLHEPFFAHLPRWTTTRRTWRFLSAPVRAAQPGAEDFSDYVRTLPSHISNWHPMGRDQYVESHTLLSGYLLSSQGDRVAMANSVEGRVPYLDHRVVEFGARLPPWLKLRGLTEKYILKKAVAPWLPAELVERTKQPYRAPDSLSFFTDGKLPDYAQELLSERRLSDAGYFDAEAVRGLVAKCAAGRAIGFADNMAFVGVLSTMLLDELYVRQRTHSPVSRDLVAGAVDVG
jgi:asparagine synthase (glutamine-hydrolysing)